MKSLEELYNRAIEMKNKGMSDKEISTELHLSVNTVTWLLSKEFVNERSAKDVKIGWRSAGVFGSRIGSLAEIMIDIAEEESNKMNLNIDAFLGITINGIPFATLASYMTGKELIVYRPHPSRKEGFFSSNFASVVNKNVVIMDDVVSTGETMKRTIEDVKKSGGKPVLCIVIASKLNIDEINGVKIRAIMRTVMV
ncbi:orotate phosphoribosyltransferase-like protein [Picrophilus oshimae]|uniref:Transcriptional regulator GfcR n=2 Tax=Picrophilus torridus (strain ATCC 700027 / DSM 9790 / JCM 10055 / NBRC 100828 / KAW 2/3) TaxID=1122961 RepID=GFCR_PICTO|nr:orotate phosphoribosyltransferase-like protein [Picrophilus oshimae]Q6L1V2.1 RecName: Full=PyrE-like protein [Picrophilus oshimae DSM 9789]AAT43050.1 orotate phosphoribosyltransferase [Picrophilus oshimae DSM 9789]SMD30643.1 orotate phosphoribosyltransferase [Picrophilus oshimae DSM 9789]